MAHCSEEEGNIESHYILYTPAFNFNSKYDRIRGEKEESRRKEISVDGFVAQLHFAA